MLLLLNYFPNLYFLNNYNPCHHRISWLSRKDSIRALATFRTIRNYEFTRGEGLEWPADRFIHLSWLTRPISFPLSFFHPSLCRYFFYSRKNPDCQPVRSPRILRPRSSSTILESPSLYMDRPIHVRYSCRMDHMKLWLNALVLGGV